MTTASSPADLTAPPPVPSPVVLPQQDRCCTCGRPRGLAQRRQSWGLDCPTVLVPRTGNPEDRPWQITNDLICNAGVWRNGGSNDKTHICDECIRIGLRHIKLKVDELLGTLEAGHNKDAEIERLQQRLGSLQHAHSNLVYAHNRMQGRLAGVLQALEGAGVDMEKEALRQARWEVQRGEEKHATDI